MIWAKYTRTGTAEARPFVPGETLGRNVSVSAADLLAGSPKPGDMIARNPENHEDQWLIAKDYFEANFASSTPPAAEELTAEDMGSVADLDDLIAVLQWVPKVNSLWGPVSDARARELECKLVDLREAKARDLKSRAGGGDRG